MKLLIFSVLFSISTNIIAAELVTDPTIEAKEIANVLIDNSAVVAEVDASDVDILSYTKEILMKKDLNDGTVFADYEAEYKVTKYVFKLGRFCFCAPKNGTLTIVKDGNRAAADGAITYSSKLEFE